MIHVTCRLTAKNRDQLRNPTLGSRVWATFTFFRTRVELPLRCADVETSCFRRVRRGACRRLRRGATLVSVGRRSRGGDGGGGARPAHVRGVFSPTPPQRRAVA